MMRVKFPMPDLSPIHPNHRIRGYSVQTMDSSERGNESAMVIHFGQEYGAWNVLLKADDGKRGVNCQLQIIPTGDGKCRFPPIFILKSTVLQSEKQCMRNALEADLRLPCNRWLESVG